MPYLTKRWEIMQQISPEVDAALSAYPPVLRQILFNRGLTTPEQAHLYLNARPLADTNPFLMTGMQASVDCISMSIRSKQLIAVYGDYDADGVTATALLVKALRSLGAQAIGYIPNRFDEGYGLNNDALDQLKSQNVSLVITVDCGIRSLPEAKHAQEIGLAMIITDHHHPGAELPPALALINPKQDGDQYPEKELAGVGLAFKLAQALYACLADQSPKPVIPLDDLLDLVAIGTVADLVPLTGENRALVRAGLKKIRTQPCQGIYSLIQVAGLQQERITAGDIGFIIGPRLNAAGRLESALDAYHLLISTDLQETGLLAQKLNVQNRERQELTRKIQEEAERIALEREEDPLLLVAYHTDFNPGVVGLAASRLTETYYRPAIVASHGEEYTRGSCRSIKEFHITDALDECADLLEHHGGHAAAAGFTVRNDRLPELLDRMQAIARIKLSGKDLRPVLVADAEVNFSQLTYDLCKQLEYLQPTGYGNPQPAFIARRLRIFDAKTVGSNAAHLKFKAMDSENRRIDAIAFRMGERLKELPNLADLLFNFEINEFNGRVTLQLNVRDIKPYGQR